MQRWLAHKYRNRYFPSPWFIYTTQEFDEIRWCQPDGLLFHEKKGILFLIEIKLRHTAAAWYQLHELYPPVVEYVFPRDIWTLRFVEVVRWYDPATYFPGRHFLRRTPHATMAGETGVVIWNQ